MHPMYLLQTILKTSCPTGGGFFATFNIHDITTISVNFAVFNGHLVHAEKHETFTCDIGMLSQRRYLQTKMIHAVMRFMRAI